MSTITELKQKLEDLAKQESAVKTDLQDEYNKIFDDSTLLRDAIAACERQESDQQYQFNKYGEIEYWHRFNNLSDFSDCVEYLETWLSEYGIRADWQNDCLLIDQGGCIVINEDGDVYDSDSGKFFINRDDYTDQESGDEDIAERNRLIEKYMDRSGYYPGVFSADSYGNVFPVNTKASE